MNLPIQVAERLAYLNAKIAEKKAARRAPVPPLPTAHLWGKGWTPEERRRAVQLSREGRSCSAIGNELGRSKNSVIGMFQRRKGK